MSRKDELKSLLLGGGAPAETPAVQPQPAGRLSDDIVPRRTMSGAVRAMSGSLGSLRADVEEARALKDLKQALDSGNVISELDPALLDPSFIHDRLPNSEDPDFEAFKAGIAEHGQKVPILVRPHPKAQGRFEIAYGHRRNKACADLGRKVRAVIAQLTDAELVVAQGKENQDRIDPSFIERTFYAKALEDRGFERSVIIAALTVDKGDLSKMLSIASQIPFELVAKIGPARKAGRPRWMTLARRLEKTPGAKDIVARVTADPAFNSIGSDARFVMLLDALEPVQESAGPGAAWTHARSQLVERIEQTGQGAQFAAYLAERINALYSEFQAAQSAK